MCLNFNTVSIKKHDRKAVVRILTRLKSTLRLHKKNGEMHVLRLPALFGLVVWMVLS